jgi:hypothetical protein
LHREHLIGRIATITTRAQRDICPNRMMQRFKKDTVAFFIFFVTMTQASLYLKIFEIVSSVFALLFFVKRTPGTLWKKFLTFSEKNPMLG